MRITLTAAGTLDGTGDAAYVWAPATWVEVGDVGPQDEGDWWRLSTFEPSDLDIRLPAGDVIDPPWPRADGALLTDADVTGQTALVTADSRRLEVSELYEHHDQTHTGLTTLATFGYEFKTGNLTPDAGDVAAPAPIGATGTYYIKPLSDADKALIKDIIIAHKAVRFVVDAARYLEFKPAGQPAELFGRLQGSYPASTRKVVGTALANETEVSVAVESNIAARDEFADVAFSGDAADVAVDASGFDGNLADTDTDVQKVAQKVDDLTIPDSSWRGTWVASADPGYKVGDRVERSDELYTCKTANNDATFTASKWWHTTDAAQYGYYDSTAQSVSGNVSVTDTDSVPIADVNESGIIATENISGFGKVYKTAALKSLALTATFNATQGVAWRLRYSDVKPTASSDAKSYGTQVEQFDSNQTKTTRSSTRRRIATGGTRSPVAGAAR